jgi:nucleotide-binding universal stress UspA family protein
MKNNKTILVGIDYTKSSENALNYAILLAEKSVSSIMLYHVYETPVVHTYSGAYFVSYPDIDKYNQEKLEKFKNKYQASHPKIAMSTLTTTGSFKKGVKDLIDKDKINYVVVGLESKTKFAKLIFGTTGVEIAGKLDCPVIIVPEKYKKHELKNSVLTVDNREYLKAQPLKQITDFIKTFKINNQNIHIKTDDEFLYPMEKNVKKQSQKLNLEIYPAKDFLTGIKKYTKENPVDIITIISRSHSAMYNLFNESNTKTIAYESHKPVLCIHD